MYLLMSACGIFDFIFGCGCGIFFNCGSRKKYKKAFKREIINYRITCLDFIFIDNGNTFV